MYVYIIVVCIYKRLLRVQPLTRAEVGLYVARVYGVLSP